MLLSPPLISDTEGSGARPYWSVMIPTYNPRADYLEETLRSVLQQDPGPEQMQIEVIDDGSTVDVAAQTVGRVGGDDLPGMRIGSRSSRCCSPVASAISALTHVRGRDLSTTDSE